MCKEIVFYWFEVCYLFRMEFVYHWFILKMLNGISRFVFFSFRLVTGHSSQDAFLAELLLSLDWVALLPEQASDSHSTHWAAVEPLVSSLGFVALVPLASCLVVWVDFRGVASSSEL